VAASGAARSVRRVGFRDGVRSVLEGFGYFLREPRNVPLAAVPVLVFLGLLLGLSWLAFTRFGPWLGATFVPGAEPWLGIDLQALLSWVGGFLAAFLALLAAMLLAAPLSAPALEALVRRRERSLGLASAPKLSVWREFAIGFRSQLVAVAFTLPAWGSLWLLGVIVPVLGPLVLALQGLLAALTVAWNLFDYPLTLRGIPVHTRWRFMRRNARAVLGFGLAFAALFWIPCAGLALLPVGVVAAAQLVALLVRARPEGLDAYFGGARTGAAP
jgi:CysZ protein